MISQDEKETLVIDTRKILFDTIGLISIWSRSQICHAVVKAITQNGITLTLDEAKAIIRTVPWVERSPGPIDKGEKKT